MLQSTVYLVVQLFFLNWVFGPLRYMPRNKFLHSMEVQFAFYYLEVSILISKMFGPVNIHTIQPWMFPSPNLLDKFHCFVLCNECHYHWSKAIYLILVFICIFLMIINANPFLFKYLMAICMSSLSFCSPFPSICLV